MQNVVSMYIYFTVHKKVYWIAVKEWDCLHVMVFKFCYLKKSFITALIHEMQVREKEQKERRKERRRKKERKKKRD